MLTNQEILEKINEKAKEYVDVVASSDEIKFETESLFTLKNSLWTISQGAMTQFLNRLKVPGGFYWRCSSTLRKLIIEEFNKRQNFFLRGIQTSSGLFCRGVVGPNFSKERDDIYIFPIIFEGLELVENIKNTYFKQTDHITEFRFIYTDTNILSENNDIKASVNITNSETGHSSIWIEPSIQVDDMVIMNNFAENLAVTRIIHRGQKPKTEEIKQAVLSIKKIAQIGMLQYLKADTEVISGKESVSFAEALPGYPKRFFKILKEDFEQKDQIKKTDVIKRILRDAKDLPILQSLPIRRGVGRFIHLFENIEKDFSQFLESSELS